MFLCVPTVLLFFSTGKQRLKCFMAPNNLLRKKQELIFSIMSAFSAAFLSFLGTILTNTSTGNEENIFIGLLPVPAWAAKQRHKAQE
jgi:hypothetical protein